MLEDWIIRLIEQLLAEGASQKRIMAMAGVSRNTLRGIARKKRPDYAAIRRAKKEASTRVRRKERCPGCGCVVRMPCLACRARSALEHLIRSQRNVCSSDPSEPLRLELKEQHRLRYEKIRARKLLRRQKMTKRHTSLEPSVMP